MVTPSVGAVILVPFPFSDLSQAKLRPALVFADVGKNDWIKLIAVSSWLLG
jgi:mRNA interferase MazF